MATFLTIFRRPFTDTIHSKTLVLYFFPVFYIVYIKTLFTVTPTCFGPCRPSSGSLY